jgi:hypothetical protein
MAQDQTRAVIHSGEEERGKRLGRFLVEMESLDSQT